MRWFALGVALAACYQPTPAPDVPCASNFACPGSQQCDTSRSPPICVTALPADASPIGDGRRDAAADAMADAAVPGSLLVQQTTKSDVAVSPLVVVLPSLPVKDDVLVMVGAATQGSLTSVSGGGVKTWTNAAMSTTYCNVEIWYGVSDGSSASVAIAITNNAGLIWMDVTEWAGVATAGTLDAANAQSAVTGDASAGAITTLHAHDLLVFGVTDRTPVTFGGPAPGSWSALTTIDDDGCMQAAWYAEVTATGTYAPSTTQSNAGWEAGIAAFELSP